MKKIKDQAMDEFEKDQLFEYSDHKNARKKRMEYKEKSKHKKTKRKNVIDDDYDYDDYE